MYVWKVRAFPEILNEIIERFSPLTGGKTEFGLG